MSERVHKITRQCTLRDSGVVHPEEPLTSGMVGTLCNVAPRTVAKWMDAGGLPHWRVPESLDRRCWPHELAKWLIEKGVDIENTGLRSMAVANYAFGVDEGLPRSITPIDAFTLGTKIKREWIATLLFGDAEGMEKADAIAKAVGEVYPFTLLALLKPAGGTDYNTALYDGVFQTVDEVLKFYKNPPEFKCGLKEKS